MENGGKQIMKRNLGKRNAGMALLLAAALVMMTGCGGAGTKDPDRTADTEVSSRTGGGASGASMADDASSGETKAAGQELEVCFGDEGTPFTLKLNDSDTAAAIARHVGTADWRLPIYEDDEDADYDVMQYYDIPDSYEIPPAPEKVTSVKAGEAYYSDPNRIVLFYQDAKVEEEYTPIGSFDATDEFVAAVRDNPVLEGWGNKIVLLRSKEK